MYEIYEKLLKLHGKRNIDVANATGIHPSTFSDWKKGKSSPKSEKLKKIADYFGVSVEYLRTGVETSGYYINDETAAAAQELFENQEMKMLFDAAKDCDPEDLRRVAELLLSMRRKHSDD